MPAKPKIADHALVKALDSLVEAGFLTVEPPASSEKFDDYLEGVCQAMDLWPDESDNGLPQSDFWRPYSDGLKVREDMAVAWQKTLAEIQSE